MNFEYFLAKRIIGSRSYKSSISAPIIKIGILAIALGIIVMLIAVATGIGLQEKIREKAIAFNGHVTINNYDSNNSNESVRPISTAQGFYPEFNTVDGITHIQAIAKKFGVIRTETDFEGIVLKGVGTDYDWKYLQEYLVAGTLPIYGETMSNDVAISEYLSKRLDFNIGDSFQMYFMKEDTSKPPFIRKFNVVGIYNSGFQELDETYFIGDIKHVQRINKWQPDEVGNFEVFIDDFDALEAKGVEIYQNTASTLNTMTVSQQYPTIFEWIKIFDQNTYGIIGIMIIVAGFNMITALLVLILERTQMIGALKALGSSNWSIRKFFLYNATYLILIGLFWGNLIGLSLLFIQKYFKVFKLDASTYYVSEAPVVIDFSDILILNIGTFILCLLMLLIPSYIITKISPVKAMRFQ